MATPLPCRSGRHTLTDACLANRAGLPAAKLHQRMDDVLAVMGLSQSRNTVVGGILAGGLLVRGLSGRPAPVCPPTVTPVVGMTLLCCELTFMYLRSLFSNAIGRCKRAAVEPAC